MRRQTDGLVARCFLHYKPRCTEHINRIVGNPLQNMKLLLDARPAVLTRNS